MNIVEFRYHRIFVWGSNEYTASLLCTKCRMRRQHVNTYLFFYSIPFTILALLLPFFPVVTQIRGFDVAFRPLRKIECSESA